MGLYKHSHEDVVALTNIIIQLSNRVVELEAELEKLRSNVSSTSPIDDDDDPAQHHPKCKMVTSCGDVSCSGECWIYNG